MEALKDDFYPRYFGENGSAARKYMDCLEEAMHGRTSDENISRVRELSKLLDAMSAIPGDRRMESRLKMLRIHHQYCVLLKEMFLAFIDNNFPAWQSLKKTYMAFFDEHRSRLEGHMAPFPPLWVSHWFHYVDVKEGEPVKMTEDKMRMLR